MLNYCHCALINEVKPDLVINAGPPWVNMAIMEACYQSKVSYLDTSVAVDLCSEGPTSTTSLRLAVGLP